jgi:hypothetical protein
MINDCTHFGGHPVAVADGDDNMLRLDVSNFCSTFCSYFVTLVVDFGCGCVKIPMIEPMAVPTGHVDIQPWKTRKLCCYISNMSLYFADSLRNGKASLGE